MTKITYTLNEHDNCESELEGNIEDIVYGLAHLVATIGWDCTDDHNAHSAKATVKAVCSFITDVAPDILTSLYEEDTTPNPEDNAAE